MGMAIMTEEELAKRVRQLQTELEVDRLRYENWFWNHPAPSIREKLYKRSCVEIVL